MMQGPSPGKGIRGWSVSQETANAVGRGASAAVREALSARQAVVGRVVLFALVLWGGGTLLFGDKGYLHLRALRAEGLAMTQHNDATQGKIQDTEFELRENPGLQMERVMRERYRKSLPNEIVYQKKVVRPDSVAAGGAAPFPGGPVPRSGK